MGRRKQNKKQNIGQRMSGTSLNEGDISGSDSEGSTIRSARSETVTAGSVEAPPSSPIHTRHRFSRINEDTSINLMPESGTSSAENMAEFQHTPVTSSNDTTLQMQPQTTILTTGSGDEPPSSGNLDTRQIDLLLQTHTKAMSDCMAGTISMLRETCESVKECVMLVANKTQDNFQQLLSEVREMRNERGVNTFSTTTNLPVNSVLSSSAFKTQNQTSVSSLVQGQASTFTPVPHNPFMASISALHTTNTSTAQKSVMPTSALNGNQNCIPGVSGINSQLNLSSSLTNMSNTQNSLTGNQTDVSCSKHQTVRLPPFTGSSSDSWKVWHARFTTIANLNKWNEVTCLSELMQRLQGTAAEFVFDEIPPEILSNYASLVSELDSRFKSVETNRTFKVQFGKRTQKYEETVEEYAAELKRLYDKAYPGRNPEMRRQLLLQQFLNGIRDKSAKFAVEYYKEPNSIEDAIHHVVTYLEAQQGPKGGNWHSCNSQTKAVRFDDDDGNEGDYDSNDEDYYTARSVSPVPKHRSRQTLRKLKNTPMKTSKEQNSTVTEEKQILQKILSFMENSSSNSEPSKVSPLQDKTGQGHIPNAQGQGHIPNAQGQVYNPKNVGQGQNQGQGRYADLQCFYCSERGHIKRNCPVLKAEREQGQHVQRNRGLMSLPQTNPARNIDLN